MDLHGQSIGNFLKCPKSYPRVAALWGNLNRVIVTSRTLTHVNWPAIVGPKSQLSCRRKASHMTDNGRNPYSSPRIHKHPQMRNKEWPDCLWPTPKNWGRSSSRPQFSSASSLITLLPVILSSMSSPRNARFVVTTLAPPGRIVRPLV